jgi:hypothetical protein
VALTTGEPFLIIVEVVNPINGKPSIIAVDYNNLPIRCRQCLSTSHLVKDCSALKGRGTTEDAEPVAVEKQRNRNDTKDDLGTGRRSEGEPQRETQTVPQAELHSEARWIGENPQDKQEELLCQGAGQGRQNRAQTVTRDNS